MHTPKVPATMAQLERVSLHTEMVVVVVAANREKKEIAQGQIPFHNVCTTIHFEYFSVVWYNVCTTIHFEYFSVVW